MSVAPVGIPQHISAAGADRENDIRVAVDELIVQRLFQIDDNWRTDACPAGIVTVPDIGAVKLVPATALPVTA